MAPARKRSVPDTNEESDEEYESPRARARRLQDLLDRSDAELQRLLQDKERLIQEKAQLTEEKAQLAKRADEEKAQLAKRADEEKAQLAKRADEEKARLIQERAQAEKKAEADMKREIARSNKRGREAKAREKRMHADKIREVTSIKEEAKEEVKAWREQAMMLSGGLNSMIRMGESVVSTISYRSVPQLTNTESGIREVERSTGKLADAYWRIVVRDRMFEVAEGPAGVLMDREDGIGKVFPRNPKLLDMIKNRVELLTDEFGYDLEVENDFKSAKSDKRPSKRRRIEEID